MLTLDGANAVAQAAAVRGRVVAVGPERAVLNKYGRPVRGLARWGADAGIDGWTRPFNWVCRRLLEANLFGTTSWEDAVERVVQQQAEWPSEGLQAGLGPKRLGQPAFPDALLDARFRTSLSRWSALTGTR